VIQLACETGIAPSAWFAEAERDHRVLDTALLIMHERAKGR
jgi:hypothetical protein